MISKLLNIFCSILVKESVVLEGFYLDSIETLF